MKRHVLILGAGFAGLELATRLSETVPDAVRVTLLDRNDSFHFGFSKLEVMLGRESADAVRMPYRDIAKDGVEFRQETGRRHRSGRAAGGHRRRRPRRRLPGRGHGRGLRHGGHARLRGGRPRVLHAGRGRASARRAGRVRGRACPRLGARAAVQVSAGAVRGVVPPARALHARRGSATRCRWRRRSRCSALSR